MAMVSPDIVQNVGDISIQFAHNQIFKGEAMSLGGFRLQGEFLSMSQMVDNSVLVPTLGGGSVQLTNNNQCGQVTFNSIRTSMLLAAAGEPAGVAPAALDGNGWPLNNTGAYEPNGIYDIISIADVLRKLPNGDGWGGTFKVEATFNGATFALYLKRVTLVRSPPFIAVGNDAPNYQVIFNYSRPLIAAGNYSGANTGNNLLTEANTI